MMKGHPEETKGGFSKQTVGIFKDLEIDYGTFDILSDEEVRQGLKTYSNWPTYLPHAQLHGAVDHCLVEVCGVEVWVVRVLYPCGYSFEIVHPITALIAIAWLNRILERHIWPKSLSGRR